MMFLEKRSSNFFKVFLEVAEYKNDKLQNNGSNIANAKNKVSSILMQIYMQNTYTQDIHLIYKKYNKAKIDKNYIYGLKSFRLDLYYMFAKINQ